jgi:hypothetical protein
MSVQDDKETGQEEDQRQTEKPEPNEDHKEKAAEMMTAYEDRPTLVLPGSAAMVTGTAVNDWVDDEGNPKCESPDDAQSQQAGDDDRDEKARQDQIEKDKALNEELKEAAAAENKGEKRPTGS